MHSLLPLDSHLFQHTEHTLLFICDGSPVTAALLSLSLSLSLSLFLPLSLRRSHNNHTLVNINPLLKSCSGLVPVKPVHYVVKRHSE